MQTWPIWVIGVVVLIVAGSCSVLVVRNRSRRTDLDDAIATARASLESAEISRDACVEPVPRADELFERAGLILAGDPGASAAAEAADLAAQADRLWQGTHG